MRKYPINSDEAISRILAAAVMADGALDKSEMDFLDAYQLEERLGLSRQTLDRVIHEYCDDLQQYGIRSDSGALEPGRDAVDAMLAEISEPGLQGKLLAAIIEITCADRRLDAAEVDLTAQAMLRWKLTPDAVGYELHTFSPRWPKHYDRAAMGFRL